MDPISAALAGSGSGSQSSSRAGLADNFQMFLTLLTEQLKNQDPLSPLDSNEFVNQLVQFSSVEQLITQNDTLDTLVGLQVAGVGGATVSYLGKEVRYSGVEAQLTENGARWSYEVAGEPATVSIAVTDAEGKVVFGAEGELTAGEHQFVWDGRDNAGELLPEGAYRLEIAAASEDVRSLPVAITAYGIVTGVDLSGTEPILVLGDAHAPFSQVQSVGAPSAPSNPEPDPEDPGA